MSSTGFVVLPDTAAAGEARAAVPWEAPQEFPARLRPAVAGGPVVTR